MDNLDKQEVLFELKKMFEEPEKKQEYIFENKQIDRTSYLSLVAKNEIPDEYIETDPDYENFINILKYQNTKDCNGVLALLQNHKRQIFLEFSPEKKADFLTKVREFTVRLRGANSKNRILVEYTLVDWANSLFQ